MVVVWLYEMTYYVQWDVYLLTHTTVTERRRPRIMI